MYHNTSTVLVHIGFTQFHRPIPSFYYYCNSIKLAVVSRIRLSTIMPDRTLFGHSKGRMRGGCSSCQTRLRAIYPGGGRTVVGFQFPFPADALSLYASLLELAGTKTHTEARIVQLSAWPNDAARHSRFFSPVRTTSSNVAVECWFEILIGDNTINEFHIVRHPIP
jgi:hypothetical protein